ASAAPWLPDECVATPRRAVASSSEKTAFVAPRALNAPIFWKFSHLKKSDATLAASSRELVSTGVRWICARIRSCAVRMLLRSNDIFAVSVATARDTVKHSGGSTGREAKRRSREICETASQAAVV